MPKKNVEDDEISSGNGDEPIHYDNQRINYASNASSGYRDPRLNLFQNQNPNPETK